MCKIINFQLFKEFFNNKVVNFKHYANMSVQYTAIFQGCKKDNFQMKNCDENPQSMFWSKNKKNNVYPCKPEFYYIKVGCKGVFITRTCFRDATSAGYLKYSKIVSSFKIVNIRIKEKHCYFCWKREESFAMQKILTFLKQNIMKYLIL